MHLTGTGKASTESDSGGSFPAGISPVFERTLKPLNIPQLWFYKCNSCDILLRPRMLRLKRSERAGGGILEMLLCDHCLIDYNAWGRSFGHSQSIRRA